MRTITLAMLDGSEVMLTFLDGDGADRPVHIARRTTFGEGSWGAPLRGYVTYDLDVPPNDPTEPQEPPYDG